MKRLRFVECYFSSTSRHVLQGYGQTRANRGQVPPPCVFAGFARFTYALKDLRASFCAAGLRRRRLNACSRSVCDETKRRAEDAVGSQRGDDFVVGNDTMICPDAGETGRPSMAGAMRGSDRRPVTTIEIAPVGGNGRSVPRNHGRSPTTNPLGRGLKRADAGP